MNENNNIERAYLTTDLNSVVKETTREEVIKKLCKDLGVEDKLTTGKMFDFEIPGVNKQ
jgi:hypothetical protein